MPAVVFLVAAWALSGVRAEESPPLVEWQVPPLTGDDSEVEIAVAVSGVETSACREGVALSHPNQAIRGLAGAPDVPRLAHVMAGVKGYAVTVTDVESDWTDVPDVDVVPAESITMAWTPGGTNPVRSREPQMDIYGASEFWPADLLTVEEAWMGTQKLVRFECRPVQYNPVTKTVRLHRRIRARVILEPEESR